MLTGLDLTAGIETDRYSAWIADLTAQHAAFTQKKLAAVKAHSITVARPAYESPGPVLSSLETPGPTQSCNHPNPVSSPPSESSTAPGNSITSPKVLADHAAQRQVAAQSVQVTQQGDH